MMNRMRDMTKWLLYILILAFIGLMVVEWGADYAGMSRRSQTTIGEIDGEEISYEQFQIAVRNARAQEEQRSGSSMNEDQVKQLRGQVWEQLVQRILLKKQIDKLNINVSDDDITNYILSALKQQYRTDPNFQTNGIFDEAKLYDVLNQPENEQLLVNLELQASQDLPFAKLVNLINSSVIVTEPEIRDEFRKKNVKAKIDFLGIPVSAFRNDSVSVSDDEIRAYYNKHKADFKVDEKRQLNYVYFSTLPTAEDTARIYDIVEELKKEVLEGKDFEALAVAESDDPTVAQNKGDLGFFERSAMVKEFADAAFSAKPGDVVGPIKTRFGLHLIKVIDRKTEDGKEKVHAAHILKKFEAGYATTDNAQAKANAFVTKAPDAGFTEAADELGLEVKETAEFSKNDAGQIPGVGRLQTAMLWTFASDVGDISEIFYANNGNYVFQLTKVVPAGFQAMDELKKVLRSRIENEKRLQMAKAYAEQFADEVRASGDFAAIAAKDAKKILKADTTAYFPENIFVPKIGRAPAIVAKAFSMPLNTVSDLLETDRGYYFIRVKDRTDFDEEAYQKEKEKIRKQLLQQKTRTVFNQWYTKLKDDANIVDNRYRFYRS